MGNKSIILRWCLTTILLFTSCKSYYNETIEWMDGLEPGVGIGIVQKNQPVFIGIDWQNPDSLEGQIRYKIIKIKGNRDILKMEHYLVFEKGKYIGHETHK